VFTVEPPVGRVAPPNLFDGAHSMMPALSRPHGQTSLPVPPKTGPFKAEHVRTLTCRSRIDLPPYADHSTLLATIVGASNVVVDNYRA